MMVWRDLNGVGWWCVLGWHIRRPLLSLKMDRNLDAHDDDDGECMKFVYQLPQFFMKICKCWKLSHQSLPPPGYPDLFPQSWMHLWRFEGTISPHPDKVSHWGEITWHKGHTRLITLSLTLSDIILSLSISDILHELLQWYTFTFGAIEILSNFKRYASISKTGTVWFVI